MESTYISFKAIYISTESLVLNNKAMSTPPLKSKSAKEIPYNVLSVKSISCSYLKQYFSLYPSYIQNSKYVLSSSYVVKTKSDIQSPFISTTAL